MWALVAAAAVLVVAVIVAVSLPQLVGDAPAATPAPPATSEPQDPLSSAVAAPTALSGAVAPDGIVFTWTNPSPKEGDTYLWGVVSVGAEPTLKSVSTPTVTVPANAGGQTCIEVMVRRANGASSQPTTGCLP